MIDSYVDSAKNIDQAQTSSCPRSNCLENFSASEGQRLWVEMGFLTLPWESLGPDSSIHQDQPPPQQQHDGLETIQYLQA
ncbi:hypothetical protein AAC387_Pa12g2121 [Persea americana]